MYDQENRVKNYCLPTNVKVAVLVSGGVDSSVAVHNLVECGIKPDLFYIRIGMEDEEGNVHCTIEEDLYVNKFLSKKYGLNLEIVDLHDEYWKNVVKYTIDSVKKGLTPNPDMMCNKMIKFGYFNDRWGKYYDKIGTGHYASTTLIDDKMFLSTAKDKIKDQTYFLGQINYQQLAKLTFPIGNLLKKEVRKIATENGLPSADRKDSQGICFLGKIHYNDFIKRYLGEKKGKIVEFETGKIIGEHNGYWFHTIGQRKGLGLSCGPWFVVKKDVEENIIFVSCGYDPQTQYGKTVNIAGFQYISQNIWGNFTTQSIQFKIRHTPEFTRGILYKIGDIYRIESEEKIQGIASGQYAVIYDETKQLCIGSGMII